MSQWYALTIDDTVQKLNSTPDGLDAEEAKRRLIERGPNQLQEKPARRWWRILLEQLLQTMVIILIVAALISFFIGDWLEAAAITSIVLLFAILGFIQDFRADRAMAALRSMTVPEIRVVRGGRETQVSSKDLVPGDVVLLEAGNIVPADIRILDAKDLKIDEAALTGESEAASKRTEPIDESDPPLGDRTNMAFSGTVVTNGRGRGIVTATGMHTEMGNIASMIQEEDEEKTPMQKELDRVGKVLAVLGIAVAILMGIIGYFLLDQPLREMFLVAVSLAVAVVPEGLPAVVTLTLSLGSQRMLRRHALIRRLPAVETLGSVTVICTDKTGTLTQNRMTVTHVQTMDAQTELTDFEDAADPLLQDHDSGRLQTVPDRAILLIALGALCNDASFERKEDDDLVTMGDPTEGALRLAAARIGLSYVRLEQQMPRVQEVSFNSDRKRMTTFHKLPSPDGDLPDSLHELLSDSASHVAITKGALDSLLEITTAVWTAEGRRDLNDEHREKILAENSAFTRKGMRVLALGTRFLDGVSEHVDESDEKDLCLIGLFGLIDPPRPEVKEAVRKCRSAGIRPIMITGDHPLTALSIAQDLEITDEEHVLSGRDLNQMSERELARAVKDISVFARVSPEHKLKIVGAFRANGEICSMTGDGVNDAPALKSADIGVAMGITGTDVAKEASDMVLLDDNYATIVAAVEEGRVIGDNVRRFVKYSIAGNIGKVIVMIAAPLFGISIALLPLQLLWLNLITDGLLGLGMSVEPPDQNTMHRPPRRPGEGAFSRGGVLQVFVIGSVIGAVALGVGAWYFHNVDGRQWQSVIFTLIAFLQVGQALAMRSDRESFFSMGFMANPLLLWMCVGIILFQGVLLYVPLLHTFFNTLPLGPVDLGICVGFGSLAFLAVEIWKVFRRRLARREEKTAREEQLRARQERKLQEIERRLVHQQERMDEILNRLKEVAKQQAP